MLWKSFGSKEGAVSEQFRVYKLHDRSNGHDGHVTRIRETSNACRILMGKPRRCEDNMKMISRDDGKWMELVQARNECRSVVSAVLNLRVLLSDN
jgi:hypothetical protein